MIFLNGVVEDMLMIPLDFAFSTRSVVLSFSC